MAKDKDLKKKVELSEADLERMELLQQANEKVGRQLTINSVEGNIEEIDELRELIGKEFENPEKYNDTALSFDNYLSNIGKSPVRFEVDNITTSGVEYGGSLSLSTKENLVESIFTIGLLVEKNKVSLKFNTLLMLEETESESIFFLRRKTVVVSMVFTLETIKFNESFSTGVCQ